MSKSLCKLKKANKEIAKYLAPVETATHICRKCGRMTEGKKRLCKPQKIKKS